MTLAAANDGSRRGAARNQAFVLHADLPGADPNDIEVTMKNGVLTPRGRRQGEVTHEESSYRRIERTAMNSSALHVARCADSAAISAQISNGVPCGSDLSRTS
ncbi:MAG TPA: Hsp20/alpha crystallin family protein [Povalibacter sp.]